MSPKTAIRAFSGGDGLESRKQARMDMYFREEDDKAIAELVAKLELHQKEIDTMCTKDADAHNALRRKEFQDLQQTILPYELPKEQLYAIMKWKHGGKFVNESFEYFE